MKTEITREINFESYNPEIHDKEAIASLIFQSDPALNSLVYGRKPLETIKALLHTSDSYFCPEYTTLAVKEDRVVGIIVAYPAAKIEEIDKLAGKSMMKAMGPLAFLGKIPLFMKMKKMMGGEIGSEGGYIHTLCIDEEMRGNKLGAKFIARLSEKYKKLYLYVNGENAAAIRFYRRNGFEPIYHGKMRYRGKEFEEMLMEKVKDNNEKEE